jgi:hypothetical protein
VTQEAQRQPGDFWVDRALMRSVTWRRASLQRPTGSQAARFPLTGHRTSGRYEYLGHNANSAYSYGPTPLCMGVGLGLEAWVLSLKTPPLSYRNSSPLQWPVLTLSLLISALISSMPKVCFLVACKSSLNIVISWRHPHIPLDSDRSQFVGHIVGFRLPS